MGIKQLYNDNLRKLSNKYGDVSVMVTIQAANNKGADQTAWMRGLICAFVVHI